ncbi:TetR family transcriptional regulator [Rhodococcus sp. X156]|uniref:TetR family transcriptional regulator n=1 Tax=Rhodococcus sp. X156 TaxID=2499145 RepID=UPI000FD80353|nr:TetR family transcriptional regulator [Rhodococcus sp. X156]
MNSRALSEVDHGEGPHGDEPRESRETRKQRTHRALLDAALELTEEQGFSSVSLRQVTKAAGIVPTAFYRHYESMDALGETLVTESFTTLRGMIRAVRSETEDYYEVIHRSVVVLVRYVHLHRAHFRFIIRERSGGVRVIRESVQHHLRLFVTELATDLASYPVVDEWLESDRELLAQMIVNQMVVVAEQILDQPGDEDAAIARAERQLRMILVGVVSWRSE